MPRTARQARPIGACVALLLAAASLPACAANALTGWTVAGAEFGSPPGLRGHDYIYPGEADVAYLAGKGMNVLRLPFRWERLQPTLLGDLAAEELALIEATVADATRRGLAVILDPHNFARYRDAPVGSPAVPNEAFADVWRRLALSFRAEPLVVFGLMNEPHDMPTRQWLAAANAAIAGIREAGAENLVLVPGNAWTGAHSWTKGGDDANAVVMAEVRDPCGNLAFELHQYFDRDYSGTAPICEGEAGAMDGLRSVTDWLRGRGARGFLGEFGAGPACTRALRSALSLLEGNTDVWLGWTAWAAGSWWKPDDPLSLQPRNGREPPQVAVLAEFAARRPAPPMAGCRKAT